MTDFAVIMDWLSVVTRWAHIAAAMAWFGAAFYFRARELRLIKSDDLPPGAIGAEWEFHGGGYFRAVKYSTAPPDAPERLGLFKWESYFTWITGAMLLALVYYAEARLYLIDEHKVALTPAMAVGISVLSLLGGWLVYDRLCAAMIDLPGHWLDALVFGLMLASSWGFYQIFTGRAAMLHLGALVATIMIGNVFFVVVRNGKKAQAALFAGQTPDPADRKKTGQRGRHTRYLHLPILFLMASVHSPLVFGTEYAWLLAPMVLAIGTMLGGAFETWHRHKVMPAWPWAASTALAILMMWMTVAGAPKAAGTEATLQGDAARLAESPRFAAVADVVAGRCSMCHAVEPAWDRPTRPMAHVLLEDPAQVAQQARQIYLHAGISTAMPPGNVTYMTDEERALIVAWYRGAAE